MKPFIGIILAASLLLPVNISHAAVNIPQPQAWVSFTFDDGYASAYSQAAPTLASQGITGTGYITTNFIGKSEYMTWDQVRALQNQYGWEIGSHSVTHPLMTTINANKLNTEVVQSKNTLKAQGLNVSSFATPFGDYDQKVIEAIAKNYTSHRPFHDQGFNSWPNNDYLLKVKQVQAGVSVDAVKGYINEAKATNTGVILVFHDVKPNASTNPEDYEYKTSDLLAIAQYVKSQNISVKNISQSLVTGQPNLLANSTFDQGVAEGWRTDSPTTITKNSNSRGSFPSPANTIRLVASNKYTHLFSPNVVVTPGQSYVLKSYLNIAQFSSDEIGYYIDEYDTNGNWVSGQYKLGVRSKSANMVNFTYAPSSSNVSKASLQVIVGPNSGITAFLDNVGWYKTN
jgi:peptidoglycan/xylan/chitin deacetylase (PgdA/CDA1 family)